MLKTDWNCAKKSSSNTCYIAVSKLQDGNDVGVKTDWNLSKEISFKNPCYTTCIQNFKLGKRY